MAVFYRLKRNEIRSNKSYGKYYAHTVRMGVTQLEQLETLIEKRCTATKGDVRLVLMELVDVMKEELQAGRTVELDGFGRFSLAVRSTCVDAPADFSVKDHVKGLSCRFTPSGHRLGMGCRSIVRPFFDGCEVRETPRYDKPE